MTRNKMKKIKLLALMLLALSATATTEAQILNKLKKRAEQAAERTILRKTDEAVSKTTEKTIDDAIGKKDKKKQEKEDEEAVKAIDDKLKDILDSAGGLESGEGSNENPGEGEELSDADFKKSGGKESHALKDNNVVLPAAYTFGYELTVKVTNHQDSKENRYLLQPDESYYAQVSHVSAGKKYVIYDEANLTLLHFLEKQGQTEFWREKMNLFTVLRMTGIANGSDDTKVKNLAKKSILGYETHGYEIATGNGVLQLWLTHDAPATMFKTMFSFRAIQKGSPFRPNDMILDMKFTSSKDATKNFSWSCTALKPYTKSFNITDYENL